MIFRKSMITMQDLMHVIVVVKWVILKETVPMLIRLRWLILQQLTQTFTTESKVMEDAWNNFIKDKYVPC